jgi:CDGSH-type Zn-finger protein
MKNNKKVIISKDGPYLVSGNLSLGKDIAIAGDEGEPEEWQPGEQYPQQEKYSLCRCGQSKNMPYCDSAHKRINFDGTEIADRGQYLKRADKISGPELDLTDVEDLCSSARFCHLAGGTWNNTENSNFPEAKIAAVKSACNCPSGRLVIWDKKTGQPIEPKLEPSVGLIEDPMAKASGPIWLKGGIDLESADGQKYETRNRVTLCRCGHSNNKPFCDGKHLRARFNDGDASLK